MSSLLARGRRTRITGSQSEDLTSGGSQPLNTNSNPSANTATYSGSQTSRNERFKNTRDLPMDFGQVDYDTYQGRHGFEYISSFDADYPRDVPAGTGARTGGGWGQYSPLTSQGGTYGDPFGDYAMATAMGGMLGSRYLSGIRQSRNMRAGEGGTMNLTIGGDENTSGISSIGLNVGIDWALGEKKATPGTPEYFRSLDRSWKNYQQGGSFNDPLSGYGPPTAADTLFGRSTYESWRGDGSGAFTRSSRDRFNPQTGYTYSDWRSGYARSNTGYF